MVSVPLGRIVISSVGPAAYAWLWLASTLVPVPTSKARANTGPRSNPAAPPEKKGAAECSYTKWFLAAPSYHAAAPNKALQPTLRAVTPRAVARVAPALTVADLGR